MIVSVEMKKGDCVTHPHGAVLEMLPHLKIKEQGMQSKMKQVVRMLVMMVVRMIVRMVVKWL